MGHPRGFGETVRKSSALDEQLQLAHGRPANVKDRPAGSQKDRSGNQEEPEVHGGLKGGWADLKESTRQREPAAADRSISKQIDLAANARSKGVGAT